MEENQLTSLRRILKIPDQVFIFAGEKLKLFPAKIGNEPGSSKYLISQSQAPDTPLQVLLYTSVNFTVPAYTDNSGKTINSFSQSYGSILMKVSQNKRIVTTEIQGRDGSIKEYIGMGDYEVQIDGVIAGANGVYPVNEVADLKKILDAPVAIDAACGYLQNLNIHSLVVTNYEISQQIGSYSYQTFSISFKSDIPQQLLLTNV